MQENEPPGECPRYGPGVTLASRSQAAEHLLDSVQMCRSVTLYALRGWFDTAADLGAARADDHRWDSDLAVVNAVERLRETLHGAVDMAADLKLSVGIGGRIQ